MLTAFLNFVCCRQQQRPLQQPPVLPTGTTVAYRSGGGLLFATDIVGGPGGYLQLTDEESSELIKSISLDMYIGKISCELTPDQITNSTVYQKALQTRANKQDRSQVSPRS